MSLARHTILLIEDDPNDSALLKRTLNRSGLEKPLQTVVSGELALTYLEGQGEYQDRVRYPLPTLIFLDLKLPGLSGFEVLTWLRQDPRFSQTLVVVLTGSKRSLDIYRAYELGANSYLVKPVAPEDLVRLAQSLSLPWLTLADTPLQPPMAGNEPGWRELTA